MSNTQRTCGDTAAHESSSISQAFDAWAGHGQNTVVAIECGQLDEAAEAAGRLASRLAEIAHPIIALTDDECATLRGIGLLLQWSGGIGETADEFEKHAAEVLYGARLLRAADSGTLEVTADTMSRLRDERDDLMENIGKGFLDPDQYGHEVRVLEGLLGRTARERTEA